jgi:2-polyprenyl-6-methoxyphenol hydroxylase-like FAD-dependent oxidoreductase
VAEAAAAKTSNTDVLIVGAGPTGLVLGLWLTLLGVRVRIVDKTEQPGTTSRALAVQARTLERLPQRLEVDAEEGHSSTLAGRSTCALKG